MKKSGAATRLGISSVGVPPAVDRAPPALVTFPVRNAHALALTYGPASERASSRDGGGVVPLASIWQRFLDGALTVVDAFTSKERCYLLVEARVRKQARPRESARSARELAILQRALGGKMQKVVALELNRSGSAISHAAASALRLLGLELSVRRAPMLLILCACAHESGSATAVARISSLDGDPGARFLISTERPDRVLPDVLSPAEREVVGGIVEGQTNIAIAGQFKSPRTVANQIASVFKKLGVGNRAELLWRLARSAVQRARDADAGEAATALLTCASSPAQSEENEAEPGQGDTESAARLLSKPAPATA